MKNEPEALAEREHEHGDGDGDGDENLEKMGVMLGFPNPKRERATNEERLQKRRNAIPHLRFGLGWFGQKVLEFCCCHRTTPGYTFPP